MDWLKRVAMVCLGTILAATLSAAASTSVADAKPVRVAKRQFFEYLDALTAYQKKHDGNIPRVLKRWAMAREIFGSDLGFGIVARDNDYCVQYHYQKHFNYDSTNDHFYVGMKKAWKADDAFCWESWLAQRRWGETVNQSWKLGAKIGEYYDANEAYPATLDAEGQAAVGYVLPKGWSVGEYRIGEQGRKAFFCVQHEKGGFNRLKMVNGSPEARGAGGGNPNFDPCPEP